MALTFATGIPSWKIMEACGAKGSYERSSGNERKPYFAERNNFTIQGKHPISDSRISFC
jgi:hypothetical protein